MGSLILQSDEEILVRIEELRKELVARGTLRLGPTFQSERMLIARDKAMKKLRENAGLVEALEQH